MISEIESAPYFLATLSLLLIASDSKQNLNKKCKVDNFILGILTGLMHGKHRKDGTSIYCSIDMPNTFSMSPNYVRNFIKTHKLTKPKQNVFALLAQRIEDILQEQESILKDLSLYKR